MKKEKLYARVLIYGGSTIWEVEYDEEVRSYDIWIDDIQGDIMVCDIQAIELEFVSRQDYDDRIAELSND